MIITKKAESTVQIPVMIKCDICKKKFNFSSEMMEIQEFVRIKFTGGYESIFGDQEDYELDMCQHCTKEKLGKFIRHIKKPTFKEF